MRGRGGGGCMDETLMVLPSGPPLKILWAPESLPFRPNYSLSVISLLWPALYEALCFMEVKSSHIFFALRIPWASILCCDSVYSTISSCISYQLFCLPMVLKVCTGYELENIQEI